MIILCSLQFFHVKDNNTSKMTCKGRKSYGCNIRASILAAKPYKIWIKNNLDKAKIYSLQHNKCLSLQKTRAESYSAHTKDTMRCAF